MRYIFESKRLGFRNWKGSDITPMHLINYDAEVMEFFPTLPSEKDTEEFVLRMQKQFFEKGFCYFAVEKLEDEEFIGFIGISEQTFESDFTPCLDIGWRLNRQNWNKGYATEGAKRCLTFAFEELQCEAIFSFCPVVNTRSESIMKKIGMSRLSFFKHPLLSNYKYLENCVAYYLEVGKVKSYSVPEL